MLLLVPRMFKFLSDSEQWIRNTEGTQGILEAALPRSGDWEQARRAAHLQGRKDFCCCLAAKSRQTLATPWTSPPGFSVHGIFQARMLEWVAFSFSRGSSQPRDQTRDSCIGRQILYHCATWEAHSLVKVKVKSQSCLTLCDSMDCNPPDSSVHGIFQARYWSGLPFPSPGDLPDPGIEPGSPAL